MELINFALGMELSYKLQTDKKPKKGVKLRYSESMISENDTVMIIYSIVLSFNDSFHILGLH